MANNLHFSICDFCTHHHGPFIIEEGVCDECKHFNCFQVKTGMHPIEQVNWDKRKDKILDAILKWFECDLNTRLLPWQRDLIIRYITKPKYSLRDNYSSIDVEYLKTIIPTLKDTVIIRKRDLGRNQLGYRAATTLSYIGS